MMIHWLARGVPFSASPTTIFTVTNLLVGVSAITGFVSVGVAAAGLDSAITGFVVDAGVSAAAVFFTGAGVTGALSGAGTTGEVTAGLV